MGTDAVVRGCATCAQRDGRDACYDPAWEATAHKGKPCNKYTNYHKYIPKAPKTAEQREVKMCVDCAYYDTDQTACDLCDNKSGWAPKNVTIQEEVERTLNKECDKVDELQTIAAGEQPHYTRFPIQPREFAHANGLGGVEYNVIKYICRYPYKGNPIKDLLKARESIEYLIKKEQEKTKC